MFAPRHLTVPFVALLALSLLSGCNLADRVFEPDKYFNERAAEYVGQGLDDKALRAFARAIEKNPRLTEAHMGMGDIYRKKGNLEQAADAYKHAVDLAPTSFDAHYHLANMQHLLGKLAEAIRYYLQALTISPEDFDANNNLAAAYIQQGLPGMAIPFAEKATRIDPDNRSAWVNLASAYSLNDQLDEAINAYRQAAELGTIDGPLLLGLADAHIRSKHYDRARVVLAAQLRDSPSALAHERMGYTLYKLRRFDEALTHYRAAVELDAKDTACLNGLGVCLMTVYLQDNRLVKSHRDDALDAWRQSLTIDANQPRIRNLAEKYRPRTARR